jgi:transposase
MSEQVRKVTSYPKEFIDTIIELHLSGKKVDDIVREYALPKSTVRTWIKRKSPLFFKDNEPISEEKYKKLLKEKNELELELEILKKAMGIFAKR